MTKKVRTGVIGDKQTGVMGYSSRHYALKTKTGQSTLLTVEN